MLWALPLHTVGKQHGKAAQSPPLLFCSSDELIDDHLRGIPEVAELRFPHGEPVRRVQTKAIFEAEDAHFRERAVVNVDWGLVRREILKRPIGPAILDVMKHGMPMAEGPALGILAGEPHAGAFRCESRERQGFTGRPVERTSAASHLPT